MAGNGAAAMNHLAEIIRFARPYVRKYWVRLVAGILFGVLFGLSNASFVWATKTLIDRMTPASEQWAAKTETTGRIAELKTRLEGLTDRSIDPYLPRRGRALDWRQVAGGLLILPLLVALRGTVSFLTSYCLGWVSERVVYGLRVNVLERLSTLSLEFFHRTKIGDLLTRVNTDTLQLQRCLNTGVADAVKEPVTILSIVAMMCVIDWHLTLAALVFFPVCILPIALLGRKAKLATRAGRKVMVSQSSQLVEVLSGIRILKAFELEGQQVDRFRLLSQALVRSNMRNLRAKELLNPILEVISVIGLGALVLYITYQQRNIDDVAGFLTGLVIFYTPVKKLAALHLLLEQTSVSLHRLQQVLAEQPTVKDPPQPQPLPAFREGITFDNVHFAYDQKPVLRDLNLHLPRGIRIGVAGESGSGKSTLVNLLFRFYDPTHGAVRIDGRNLREVALRDLRRLMALVSQEVVVFDLTVAENIAAGKTNATRAEIEAAARAAYAHDFISRLPQGYDTPIGERGASLSVGQRQRISIARAFIRNAPILVLDEATAALDAQSEAEVQAAIERLEENRTVLCVAHRLSTLANMDRIIVLADGGVREDGSFAELLRRGGEFAAMARKQGITAPPHGSRG